MASHPGTLDSLLLCSAEAVEVSREACMHLHRCSLALLLHLCFDSGHLRAGHRAHGQRLIARPEYPEAVLECEAFPVDVTCGAPTLFSPLQCCFCHRPMQYCPLQHPMMLQSMQAQPTLRRAFRTCRKIREEAGTCDAECARPKAPLLEASGSSVHWLWGGLRSSMSHTMKRLSSSEPGGGIPANLPCHTGRCQWPRA